MCHDLYFQVVTTASPPLHQWLSDVFRSRIESGVWGEGSRLPSESELCNEFGTSRGPVRQALSVLRREGVIVGGRGSPPHVRRAVLSQPFSAFLSFTEWARSIGRVPGQRTLEIALRTGVTPATSALGLQPGETLVEVLRLRLLDDEPTMVERSYFPPEIGRALFDFDTESGSIFAFLLARGVDLHRASHTIDAIAADSIDSGILGIANGSPLLRERRVTSDRAGNPLEYADDRYRSELSNFTIENVLERPVALARVSPPAHAVRADPDDLPLPPRPDPDKLGAS